VPKKTADKKAAPAATGEEKKAPAKTVAKAQKIQKKIIKGTHGTRVKKVRTSVHFHRPRTFRPVRAPKYPRKSTPARNR
jgi:large subunit ribosomal protein L23Ae